MSSVHLKSPPWLVGVNATFTFDDMMIDKRKLFLRRYQFHERDVEMQTEASCCAQSQLFITVGINRIFTIGRIGLCSFWGATLSRGL